MPVVAMFFGHCLKTSGRFGVVNIPAAAHKSCSKHGRNGNWKTCQWFFGKLVPLRSNATLSKNKTVDAKGFDAKTNPGALAKADTKHLCGRLDRIFYGNKTGWTFQGGSSDVDAFQEVFSENLGFNSNINQLREGLQARLSEITQLPVRTRSLAEF